jgi:hypothetical protein
MRTKSRLAGERCDRNLGGSRQCGGQLSTDFSFFGYVPVRVAGFRSAGGIDEEDGVGTGEVCGVLFLEVFGGGDRHWLADVPLLALKYGSGS